MKKPILFITDLENHARLNDAEALGIVPQVGWQIYDGKYVYFVTVVILDAIGGLIRVSARRDMELSSEFISISSKTRKARDELPDGSE